MMNEFNIIMNNDDVILVGMRDTAIPPHGKKYYYNSLVLQAFFIDGDKLNKFIDDIDWEEEYTFDDSWYEEEYTWEEDFYFEEEYDTSWNEVFEETRASSGLAERIHSSFLQARKDIGSWTNLSDSPYISQRNRALGM